MGLLDGLKRDKTSLTLEVDPPAVLPGGEVRIRVTVAGEIDDKAQSLRAGVRCVNNYLVHEDDHDDDDNRVREVWRAISLHEEAHELPIELGTHDIACVVPPHALQSSENAVGWWAWAQLDRRKGIDVKESVPFGVLVPLGAFAAPAGPPPPGEGGVSFDRVPASAAVGGDVSGTLSIAPPEDLKVTGIEVTLRRVRTYAEGANGTGSRITKSDDVATVEVSGKAEFRGGDTAQVPFSLTIPPGSGPTVTAPHTMVAWMIAAKVKRRMRGDHVVKAPLTVYNA